MDSTEIIAGSIQDAARDLMLPVPSTQEAKYVIGLGLADSIAHLFPNLDAKRQLDVIDRFRVHYLARENETPLYPGVKSMLSRLELDGFLLAIATGKARRGLDRVLTATNLKQHFVTTRCADEGLPKPHPDMVEHILKHTRVDKSRAVMVGDTTHDLELAKNAGIAAIAVDYGAHKTDALAAYKPHLIANTVPELTAWILRCRDSA